MKKVLILLALPSVALKQSLGISLEVQEDLSAKTVADAQRLARCRNNCGGQSLPARISLVAMVGHQSQTMVNSKEAATRCAASKPASCSLAAWAMLPTRAMPRTLARLLDNAATRPAMVSPALSICRWPRRC